MLYLPDNPAKARIGTTGRLLVIPLVLFGIGALMIAIATWGPALFDGAVS